MYSFLYLSLALSSAIAGPTQLWPRSKGASNAGAVDIDFAPWKLQLPVGETGHPETISSKDLQNGYSDPNHEYFYQDGDVLVMKVPGGPDTGCVTTKNSLHCRTELRESSPSSWDPKASTNVLRATLTVVKADSSSHGTVIGQIHIDDSISSKPICELFYSNEGVIAMGVEKTRDGGSLTYGDDIDVVPLGTQFSYEIRYENGKLSVSVNDGEAKELDTFELDSPDSYFKAGNYNQAKGGEDPSEVHFTSITVEH